MAIFDNLITGSICIVVLVYFGTTFYIDKQSKRKRHNNWDDTNDLYDYIDSDEDDAGGDSDDGGIDFDFGD